MWDWVKKIVLIVGCPRSGLSVPGFALGAHPNVIAVHDCAKIGRWFRACAEGKAEATRILQDALYSADLCYLDQHKRLTAHGGDTQILKRDVTHLVMIAPKL